MNLKEILSITGQSGLFKYVAQAKGGIIVESLLPDAKRMMVSGSAKVSALGDIAIFTETQEVPLADIFETIAKNNDNKAVEITNKSTPEELAAFMTSALAQYDKSRVHNSDIKKLAAWYNILVASGITTFTDKEDESAENAAEVAPIGGAEKIAKPRRVATPAITTKAKAASSKPKVTAPKSTTARKSS